MCTVHATCARWDSCTNRPVREVITGQGHGWTTDNALLLAHADFTEQLLAKRAAPVERLTEICYAIPIPDKKKPAN